MLHRYLILAFALLAGCANGPSKLDAAHATYKTWPPLSPESLGETLVANQLLRVAYADRETTLNCVVSITPQQIEIIGVTALGMRVFTVKYDGKHVAKEMLPSQSQSQSETQSLPPERLLNDLQLVYWPLSALKAALANSDWHVTEPAPMTRRLRHGARLIAEVHYTSADPWDGRAWLVNLELDYTLNIQSQRSARH